MSRKSIIPPLPHTAIAEETVGPILLLHSSCAENGEVFATELEGENKSSPYISILDNRPISCDLLFMPEKIKSSSEEASSRYNDYLHFPENNMNPCGISNVLNLENLPEWWRTGPILLSLTSCKVIYIAGEHDRVESNNFPIEPYPSTFVVNFGRKSHTGSAAMTREKQSGMDSAVAGRHIDEIFVKFDTNEASDMIQRTFNLHHPLGFKEDKDKKSEMISNTTISHTRSKLDWNETMQQANEPKVSKRKENVERHKLTLLHLESRLDQDEFTFDLVLRSCVIVSILLTFILVWTLWQHFSSTKRSDTYIKEVSDSMIATHTILQNVVDQLEQSKNMPYQRPGTSSIDHSDSQTNMELTKDKIETDLFHNLGTCLESFDACDGKRSERDQTDLIVERRAATTFHESKDCVKYGTKKETDYQKQQLDIMKSDCRSDWNHRLSSNPKKRSEDQLRNVEDKTSLYATGDSMTFAKDQVHRKDYHITPHEIGTVEGISFLRNQQTHKGNSLDLNRNEGDDVFLLMNKNEESSSSDQCLMRFEQEINNGDQGKLSESPTIPMGSTSKKTLSPCSQLAIQWNNRKAIRRSNTRKDRTLLRPLTQNDSDSVTNIEVNCGGKTLFETATLSCTPRNCTVHHRYREQQPEHENTAPSLTTLLSAGTILDPPKLYSLVGHNSKQRHNYHATNEWSSSEHTKPTVSQYGAKRKAYAFKTPPMSVMKKSPALCYTPDSDDSCFIDDYW